jgi:transglutaminase-like putative cysteine protease
LYLKQSRFSTLGGGSKVTATLANIPDGKAGTIATLKIMRQFARDSIRAPSQTIRTHAMNIVASLPARSFGREVESLHAFVRDQIRYVRDPVDLESVATPEKTLELGQGDCDDKATLLAALLESVGHPARFVAVGFGGAPFSHVYTESKIGESWVPLETIIPRPMGWYPMNATSRYILKV